jgi:hypothetical protein
MDLVGLLLGILLSPQVGIAHTKRLSPTEPAPQVSAPEKTFPSDLILRQQILVNLVLQMIYRLFHLNVKEVLVDNVQKNLLCLPELFLHFICAF